MVKTKLLGRQHPHPGQTSETTQQAEVVASHGRHFMALTPCGKFWQVFGKGKKREVAVGDQLMIQTAGDNQAWVDQILDRKNLLYRSDATRNKLFASNLDLVLLVLSINPPFSGELLGRTLVACATAGIELRIVFNKVDLIESEPELQAELENDLQQWANHTTPIHWFSLKQAPSAAKTELDPLLLNKTCLVLGQSGMGKSTLINLMVPDALAATNEVSMALNAGKHTTTNTQMHLDPRGIRLIDSPGFQAFGLHHLTQKNLLSAFPEIEQAIHGCRFNDCQHDNEPESQCAVKRAVQAGDISSTRFEFFQMMSEEIRQASRHWER